MVGGQSLRQEVDKGLRALAQSALAKLDVVSREEFDIQADVLKRTRARVIALEGELAALTEELEALTKNSR
jgi:BMFP domain-containing protein YqiC